MSVQFGRWNFEGQPPAPDYIEKVSAALAPQGPDSNESYSKDGIKILYRAFHTTKESHREKQPCISPSGAVITWDGRLDNRVELISELRLLLSKNSVTAHSVAPNSVSTNSIPDFTDVQIVAAAYEQWGSGCLGKLIGDWALSIWNPRERSVLLAKDPIGTHHLYYSIEKDHVTWSTILDPLVLFVGKTLDICEEYIAGWLATMFPAPHLTPYVSVHSVTPSCFVLIRPGNHTVSKYWDFDKEEKVRYHTDAEYEEHFRLVFGTAVQRRLRCDRPVLAELSGGVDSSSIVCMADSIIARGAAETPRLDTITWYDAAIPNWGEHPYFTKIEERRGRTGCHIDLTEQGDVSSQKHFRFDFDGDRLPAIPIPNNAPSGLFEQHAAHMRSRGHRVTLSGIGGGEVTGDGVPTPSPELQDLLARARFFRLVHQLNAWAVKMRKARLPLLWEAVRGFLPLALAGIPKEMRPAPWLHAAFVRRNRAALCGYPCRVKLFGPLPSFQGNLEKMDAHRRFLAECGFRSDLRGEVRYPYFDRDFLEFMYAIPREQVVRVGQRRSLMRRALIGIVPEEILNRRRKAFVPPGSKQDNFTDWPNLPEMEQGMVGSFLGIIDLDRFGEALQKARRNEEIPINSLKRTLSLESWLRHLTVLGVRGNTITLEKQDNSPSLEAKERRFRSAQKSSAS
jgi:asparagine synthase (glutamine-hydrolysing)